MAHCPHCQREYTAEPNQEFCEGCGKQLSDVSVAVSPTGLDENQGTAEADGQPVMAGNTRVQGVGEGNVAERDVVINQTVQLEFCAAGHEQLFGDRTLFRCPDCQRYPICDHHFNQSLGKCSSCAEGPKIACALCNDRLPASQTFACRRCKRVVGSNHLDPNRDGLCTDCGAHWDGVVQSMERDEVGISADGTVVGRDDVELKNKVLVTKEGQKPVAAIKENIWYARSHPWHEVKPRLLRQERQAMRRFYPSFRMDPASNGDLYWHGIVTTWLGNDYEIQLHYPISFPYVPPKAYVVEPKISQSRHIYPDGHLCLFHRDDSSWEPTTTAATVMSWVSLWLHCYEAWQETGVWPRQEHDDVVITTAY